MNPEQVDLEILTNRVAGALDQDARRGYLTGKTAVRDWVVRDQQCSQVEAESLVDTMCSLGWLRYTGDPETAGAAGYWVTRAESA